MSVDTKPESRPCDIYLQSVLRSNGAAGVDHTAANTCQLITLRYYLRWDNQR